ncbi:MAG TPA: hypothetical protein VII33_20015 [Nakamurella sp.]
MDAIQMRALDRIAAAAGSYSEARNSLLDPLNQIRRAWSEAAFVDPQIQGQYSDHFSAVTHELERLDAAATSFRTWALAKLAEVPEAEH